MAGKRITNMLILKMAIADLLVTPDICDAIQRSCSQHRSADFFGEISYKSRSLSLYQMSTPASIFIVMVVSIDRFVATMYPMKLRVLPKTKMTTFVIWVCSASNAFHDLAWDLGTRSHLRLLTLLPSP
ncbi:hypothetical protein P5673_017652 [Acropora cervicornis]|uniref:G-protein coupled receptors family 1 profile domain-containing protein n=1 Tax=Acropora cervicornis TaxID=6130 RepID=A0AAD9QEQ0_ACRCE|nr:hypothetical protein P5673_017652 [Acropora cervicornis]